jgi:hypothetical protein
MFIRALAAAGLTASLALAAAASAAAEPSATITIENLAWGDTHRAVRAALTADGFTPIAGSPADFYRGSLDGAGVTAECVFTPDDQLVFVRVIFDPGADRAAVVAAVNQADGTPAACDAQRTHCRWERGSSAVAYAAAGDPYAGPNQASLEFSAGGSLAAGYAEETNNTEYDNDRGMDR